ncbi:MAG: tetratricopeptide repeat protein [Promethearchaeota archaeon]|nr:MAG: tetratricopeptide repeat protein [Candidatus Lokiarchaeota archaeon]
MVKKSDLKKLNSIMQEGNDFKNDNKYNKAVEKYFEALNFVESNVKDSVEKEDEITSIKSQIDQVYSIEIIDQVDNASEYMEKKEFENAFEALEEGMRIADKIEDKDMKNYEIQEISYLTEKYKISMALQNASKQRDEGNLEGALQSMQEILLTAKEFHQNDPENEQIKIIKDAITETYSLLIKEHRKIADQLKGDNQLEKALEKYGDALIIANKMAESEVKVKETTNLKNSINQIYSSMIKPLVDEGNLLFNENKFEAASKKFEDALAVADKMYPSAQKEEEIENINNIASKTLNPVYLERMKPILDKGKELIIKEFYEDNISIVNEAIDKFIKALELAENMGESKEKEAKVEEIKQLINKTCRARINILKDRSLQKIAKREFDKAVNELYAAISVAKRMPIEEEENADYIDLKQAVNDVYNSQIDEILRQGSSQLVGKNYDKAIEIFNEALKMTDKMYLTEEMEQVVNKIKGMIYQAELKLLVGKGDSQEEKKKFERELERLNKKMEYAQTIDDAERRFEEMEKIKTSIDEVHYSEIKLLVEQGIQLAGDHEFTEGFDYFEKAMKVHELIESPEFKNKIPIKFHYKTELVNKAKLEISEKKYDQAIHDCEKAIELDSTFIDAYYYIGLANIQKENFDQSIASFNKAIGLKNDHAESWNQLGYAHERKNEFENAIKAYNRAIEINPNFAEAYYNLGNVLKITGSHNDAIDAYQKATKFDQNLTLAWLFLAAVFIEKKDYANAITNIEKALDVKPEIADTLKSLIDKFKGIIQELDENLREKFKHRNE